MAINYELERHIRRSQEVGDRRAYAALKSLNVLFNDLKDAGVIEELPREQEIFVAPPIERATRDAVVEVSGEQMRLRRAAKGLTLRGLAAAAGRVSPGYLARIERQTSARIGRPKAERLAGALDVALDDLLATDLVDSGLPVPDQADHRPLASHPAAAVPHVPNHVGRPQRSADLVGQPIDDL